MTITIPIEYGNGAKNTESESQRTLHPYVTGTSVVAIKYRDGILMASDMGGSYGSSLGYKNTERIKAIGKHSLLGASGEISDFQEILRYLDELMLDDDMWDDGNSLGPKEVHNYLTRVMYNRRNKFNPLWNTLVLGGVKNGEKYLGMVSMIGVSFEDNHVATGVGNHLARPILRDEWREDLSFEDGVMLLEKCMRVLLYRDRSAINKLQIAKMTEEGVTVSEPYSLKTFWGKKKSERDKPVRIEGIIIRSTSDCLRQIEDMVHKWWEEEYVFKADAAKEGKKFFSTPPFPYMNGNLHTGHAFTISKADFAAAYHRLKGSNVLLPLGFHCTGMPIKASADMLYLEIQQLGDPAVFPAPAPEAEEKSCDSPGQLGDPLEDTSKQADTPGQGTSKGKKSKRKLAAKAGSQVRQWEILRRFGISDTDIPKFTDPSEWVDYFPPLAVEDLKAYGLGCDWRRSFVTTNANPFFDAFVKWQMRKLMSKGKIVEECTYKICSPLDLQPYEGVRIQEYTLVKMEVIDRSSTFDWYKQDLLDGKDVFLAAPTVRPETLCGQTNVWVFPDGVYGAYEINETDVFIVSKRAGLNLAYQNLSKTPQKPSCLFELTGFELIGVSLRSPLSPEKVIYALPMFTIPTNKGTGILISVPSDDPGDYMALHDLNTKKRPCLRKVFDVKDAWVLPVFPIIEIPKYGNKAAEKVCKALKIKSQLDEEKLEDAKKLINRKGFSKGKMLTGQYSGWDVKTARPKIQDKLIKSGAAVLYYEPEKPVMSRSGDECVVTQTKKWYITYGEEDWRKVTGECLSSMELYSQETRVAFGHTLIHLNQWPCSSSSGPGTRIPWDQQLFVEFLSDSSMYMPYYTISHYFHDGDMYAGSKSLIRPEQMSDEVWDHIFCDGQYPQSSDIQKDLLSEMKTEFEYWYPSDLQVSGRDLIQNQLMFLIYNHTALLKKRYWPRGIRCNGHMTLNSERVSYSTGNFRTLSEAIKESSATALRFSLADAGDNIEDVKSVSENAAILRLPKELIWMYNVLQDIPSMRGAGAGAGSPPSYSYADKVFQNAMNIAVSTTEKAYNDFMFKRALKHGFFEMQAARDEYRLSCGIEGTGGMNRDMILRFLDVQTRLIAPICPQFADFVWRKVLKNETCVLTAGWPTSGDVDLLLQKTNTYLQDSIASMRKSFQKVSGKNMPNKEKLKWKGLVYVNEQFDGWRAHCLEVLQSNFVEQTRSFPPLSRILTQLAAKLDNDPHTKKFVHVQKQCMPFLKLKMQEALALGDQALSIRLAFDELGILQNHSELIKLQLGVKDIEFGSPKDAEFLAKAGESEQVYFMNQLPPYPGNPSFIFVQIEQ